MASSSQAQELQKRVKAIEHARVEAKRVSQTFGTAQRVRGSTGGHSCDAAAESLSKALGRLRGTKQPSTSPVVAEEVLELCEHACGASSQTLSCLHSSKKSYKLTCATVCSKVSRTLGSICFVVLVTKGSLCCFGYWIEKGQSGMWVIPFLLHVPHCPPSKTYAFQVGY